MQSKPADHRCTVGAGVRVDRDRESVNQLLKYFRALPWDYKCLIIAALVTAWMRKNNVVYPLIASAVVILVLWGAVIMQSPMVVFVTLAVGIFVGMIVALNRMFFR